MTDSRTVTLLIALCAATFVVTSSGPSLAPFLALIADDLSTNLPSIAHLFSIQAVVWGMAALVAGMFSDRYGRRGILVGAVVLLGTTRFGFAHAHSYAQAVSWQIVSGLGGGAFMGTVYATVSDHVPPGTRGRAMSWVITGQSLSLLLGVPIVTLLGALGGWRGAIAMHGGLVLLVALWVRLVTPPDPPHHAHASHTKTPLAALLKPKLIALLAAGTTERFCFAALAVYLPTYLQQSYGVSLGGLAIFLALVSAGNLIGNIVGGRIADRTRSRARVFAIGSGLTAVLALPTLMWQPGIAVSVGLGFAYSLVNAAGRPSLMATLAEMPSELRGALFGLNITMASIGWLTAGSVGAWLIADGGFTALGVFASIVAAIGCGLAVYSVTTPALRATPP